LMRAAELVLNAGGRVLAFVKSDQILLSQRDINHKFTELVGKTCLT